MSAPRLRAAVAQDAAGIVALEALFPGDRMSLRSVRRFLREPGARVWVVEVAGEIVGAVVLLLRRGAQRGRIYSLAVRPDWRGQGLAQQLLSVAEGEAQSAGRRGVTLEVRADNLAARALYRRCGYQERAILPAQYEDGADGLRLQRDFVSAVSLMGDGRSSVAGPASIG